MQLNIYKQGKEQAQEIEKNRLNLIEKKITSEKAHLETQLKMLESEEKTTSEAESKAAEAAAPKYA